MISQHIIHDLNELSVKKGMTGFYHEIISLSEYKNFTAISMPILLPDGWQTVIHIDHLDEKYIELSDHGKISTWLIQRGLNTDSDSVKHIIAHQCKKWNVLYLNGIFKKPLSLPFQAKELQLFAEFMSAIAHLIYKVEAKSKTSRVAYDSIIHLAETLHLNLTHHSTYPTQTRTITVDFSLLSTHKDVAIKTFDTKSRASDMMEIWSYRMAEIQQNAPSSILTSLIYNEDICLIDHSTLALAKSKCNFVCPIHRQDEIRSFLLNS